ncbi:set domain-containing protein 5 [Diplodia corticola]|uniref:Set domain-containing protein 5 n=1 Tax=Diplodia corticola TaxID=236234 RepID=A0A1J9QXT0_9PEZI|nr:set domain-containing protein 5 [Diplodia corticola]OJD33200.1 set domain-containing protein 5 [Diplodia corticola]
MAMFEFRQIEGAGTATFATQDIPRGSKIHQESPLMVYPTGEDSFPPNPDRLFNKLVRGSNNLDDYMGLFALESCVNTARETMGPAPTGAPAALAEVKAWALGIYCTNCFNITIDAEKPENAVYKEMSRLNHVCCNNATWSTGTKKSLVMSASRDIKAGEEITTRYSDVWQPYSQRQSKLSSSYGFRCRCALCEIESYVENTLEAKVYIFGRLLVQQDLRVMTRFFRKWFNSIQWRNDKDRASWCTKNTRSLLDINEAVGFAEIALDVLGKIVERERTNHGPDSIDFQNATKNVDAWGNVIADLRKTYGDSSVWLESVNAEDPRF